MLTFRPLSLTFVALVFAIVHPAVSHPIQSLERATKDHFNGLLSRNSQRALEDDGDTLPSQSSATIHSQVRAAEQDDIASIDLTIYRRPSPPRSKHGYPVTNINEINPLENQLSPS